jgi:hypothetical protein
MEDADVDAEMTRIVGWFRGLGAPAEFVLRLGWRPPRFQEMGM